MEQKTRIMCVYAPGVIHSRLCAFKMQSLAILDYIHFVNLIVSVVEFPKTDFSFDAKKSSCNRQEQKQN